MYVIWLEDYHLPRYASIPKPYVGAREDIEGLMEVLSQMPWADERYADLISKVACQNWDSDVITHTVAGKRLQLLQPVKELYRNTFSLEEPAWEYKTITGNGFPMTAKRVEVAQVLVRWPDGKFCRCVKANFEDLMVRSPGIGWCLLKDVAKGFPGLYQMEGAMYIPRLYTLQQVYAVDQWEQAVADMKDFKMAGLAVACQDILGEI